MGEPLVLGLFCFGRHDAAAARVRGAVVHADGTGRIQTVSREVDPLYWQLLERVGERTGVPVLLNTSFNIRGEPMVNTLEDAVACFLAGGLAVRHPRALAAAAPGV